MGGKSYLAGWLSEKIPMHTLYIEPFCGGALLLFGKSSSAVEVLNDADSHLITFFRVIQEPEKRQMLMERLAFMPYSRALWQEIRSRWKQGDIPCDPVEASAEWFYLNRTCFGGDQKRGGFGAPSVTGRNPAQSYFNAIDGLESIARRLRGVTIECLDYADCIRRYDSPDSVFYCDPPYLDSEYYYERGNFNQEDHHALAKLKRARQWFHTTPTGCTMNFITAGVGMSISRSKVAISRKVKKSQKRLRCYTVTLNRQGERGPFSRE